MSLVGLRSLPRKLMTRGREVAIAQKSEVIVPKWAWTMLGSNCTNDLSKPAHFSKDRAGDVRDERKNVRVTMPRCSSAATWRRAKTMLLGWSSSPGITASTRTGEEDIRIGYPLSRCRTKARGGACDHIQSAAYPFFAGDQDLRR